jgi:hypothetical protein
VKKILYILLFGLLLLSCKKEEGPEPFDFDISAVEPINAYVEDTKTIRLLVTCNKAFPENVFLSLQDVPSGITCTFDRTSGVPEFASNLEIKISRTAAGGLHIIRLIGTSNDITKEVLIEINVDRSLSATFTVYNALNYDPNDVKSNLVDSALVKLYINEAHFLADSASYKEYTRTDGKAYFYKIPGGIYLFTIQKDTLSNVILKRDVGGVMKGYIVAGMFRTQQEIINSAQPTARPGDLKYRDVNADNKIDSNDLGQYDIFSIYPEELNEKVIWIGK